MKLSFKSKRHCSGNYPGGDIYISVVHAGNKGKRHAICARFSGDTLRRLRWMCGDRVTFEFQREADTDIWTFTRVSENDREGLKLSDSRLDSGACSVRTMIEAKSVAEIFKNERRAYVGTLVEHDNKRASFVFENNQIV